MGFLAPEALIMARLEARIATADWSSWSDRKVPRVFTAADSANVEERSHLAPAYYVVFESSGPVQANDYGRIQQLAQHWAIYGAVRNAAKHGSGQGVRDNAGVMMDLALTALCGWSPSNEHMPLRMIESAGLTYSDAGYGYFAFLFETRCVVRGEP